MTSKAIAATLNDIEGLETIPMNLAGATIDVEYIIRDIDTDNEEMKDFLFTLGCYTGEKITVISKLADNFVVSIKDARYSIDADLAEVITI